MSQHLNYHKDSVLSSHYGKKKNYYCYYYNAPLKKPNQQHTAFKWQIENAIVLKNIPKDIRNALLG